MPVHRSNIKRKSRIPKGAWPVKYTSLRALTNDFLEIESMGFEIAKRRSLNIDADQMHQDYLWKRSEFFLQIAGLCGEDKGEAQTILDETVMEFSLKVG